MAILNLADSARHVLETAQRDHLPLAFVAEREEPGRAAHWFAGNMLSIVDVHGVGAKDAGAVSLTKDRIAGLTLADAMDMLKSANGEPVYVNLSVTDREQERYLRWARTVA